MILRRAYVLYWSRRGFELYGSNSQGTQVYRCYTLEEIEEKLKDWKYESTGRYKGEKANYGWIGKNRVVITAGALAGLQARMTYRPRQEKVEAEELETEEEEVLI